MRPSQTILVLEDLRAKLAGPLHRKGIRLDSDDAETTTDVYLQWVLLMVDLGYLHPDTLKRDAHRLLSTMIKVDVLDLNNAFAELLGRIRVQDFKGFKALCGIVSPHLYYFIKDDVELCSQNDVRAAKRLMQLFAYTSRLSLHNIDLTQQCLDDYMETEDQMSDYAPKHLILPLNNIIKRWMKSFDPDRLKFQHGPGGVAGHGRTSLEVKYKDLTFDARTSYAFGDPWWSTGPIRSSLDRISQTIFVPKSYKTFRTISMESSTLQYLQQGVWREIDRLVLRNRYLRNRIDFHDQLRNQRLAQRGSLNRTHATIDLSAASDSVSYSLVKRVFRGTKLLRYLVATRSSRTLLPDGRIVRLKKFAPMGSALCFPIETIIFAAICELVTQEHAVNGDYSVFGDDIIVPTQCVEDIMHVLETLGFRVNRDKSFYRQDCWFRESCGAEYCDGFDVTPMRVSRKYKHKDRLERLAGLMDLANAAYSRGFVNLRIFFIRKLVEAGFKPLFGPHALHGDNYTNYHLKKRWRRDWQIMEVRATGLRLQKPGNQDEDIRYRHWLECNENRKQVIDAFVADVSRPRVYPQNCWRQKPPESIDRSLGR